MARRLVVVGDTLLDRDVDGHAERICPDAPAVVLQEQAVVERPGGAGLAALLGARDEAEVTLVTALSDDAGGRRLGQLLGDAGVTVVTVPTAGSTPEKIRVRADGQVLLRWDRGGGQSYGRPDDAALAAIYAADAVLVSDYGHGVSALPEIRTALAESAAVVVWDPHPEGAVAVPGARLLTPNEAELSVLTDQAAGRPATSSRRLAVAAHRAERLREHWRVGAVAVTLGADGALLSHAGPTPLVVPPPARAEGDSCGAGDRFAISATLALAEGALVSEAVEVAVVEASRYVAQGAARTAIGPGGDHPTAPLHRPARTAAADEAAAHELVTEVRARGGTVVATGGCFDLLHAGHASTLEAARGLGDCLVVCVNSDASVAGLKGPGRPLVGQDDRVRLLAALGCVDAVVLFDEPTPAEVLSRLRPDIWVKGGDYAGGNPDTLPEAELVRSWGGQTVIVPYLDGRSTSRMIAAARAGSRAGAQPLE